jgi:hypothetical protein
MLNYLFPANPVYRMYSMESVKILDWEVVPPHIIRPKFYKELMADHEERRRLKQSSSMAVDGDLLPPMGLQLFVSKMAE